MYSLLIAIIYLAFISLGLPDSLLGSGWPVMHNELGVPLSYAGIVSMIITGGTIVSSLASDYLTRKLNPGLLTALSVALTAAALFGFSVCSSFWALCLLAIPYGLGAGAVDAALNNYVALHYSSRHMSWLHAFWGLGVTVSPYVMSFCLTHQLGWNMGYRSISIVQIIITAILFASLPLWRSRKSLSSEEPAQAVKLSSVLKIKGVKHCLIAFLCFCAFEATAGLWASSYMVIHKGIDANTAARFAALFYMGITAGRFLSGIIADKVGDRRMTIIGMCVVLSGIIMMLLPFGSIPALAGLLLAGFGSAPVYPSIIHATPSNFGRENSQALVGIQMASAYCGSTLAPPVFGFIAQYVNIGLYPVYLGAFAIITLAMAPVFFKKELIAQVKNI